MSRLPRVMRGPGLGLVLATLVLAANLASGTETESPSMMAGDYDYDYDYDYGAEDNSDPATWGYEAVINTTCPENISEDWWFDCFTDMMGDSVNCGGAAVDRTVTGKTDVQRAYCGTISPWCPPHMVISGSNQSTHILKDDRLFGIPTEFGNATVSFDMVVSSQMDRLLAPVVRLYDDCNGTVLATTYMPTSSMMAYREPMCGEVQDMSRFYTFRWDNISTANFTMGKTLSLEWTSGGPMAGNILRLYKFGLLIDKPYSWRKSLVAPICSDTLQHASCSAITGGGPMARRGPTPLRVPLTAEDRLQRRAARDSRWTERRRDAPELVCTGGGPTTYLALVYQASDTVKDDAADYVAALNAFVDELEELPVGIAVIEFWGPRTYWDGVGALDDDSRYMTPVGGSEGVYRMMDNPVDVTQLRADIAEIVFGGGSNWEAGFDRARALEPTPNNTIFLTDGNPTSCMGYCYSSSSSNSDFYAAEASKSAQMLKAAGSRIIPLLVGDNLDETFLVSSVVSDGKRSKIQYCSNPPSSFSTQPVIGSPVSGHTPLLVGKDYFYAPNYAAVTALVQGNLTVEVCTEQQVEETQSLSQSPSHSASSSQSRSTSPSQSRSTSPSQSRSTSPSQSRSTSPSRSHSSSQSASTEEYVVEVVGSVVFGAGPNNTQCQVDQSEFWYDAMGITDTGGDSVVCGGAQTNTTVVGKTDRARHYCDVQGEKCLQHVLMSGSNMTTHVMSADQLFGVPTTFGVSTFDMHILFNTAADPAPVPRLVVYTDCEGSGVMRDMAATTVTTPEWEFTCGEVGATYYRYEWTGVSTVDFTAGCTLAIIWDTGMDLDVDVRVFEWELAVDEPARRRVWLNAPVCDAQLQLTDCPEARRAAPLPAAPATRTLNQRRRMDPPEMCMATNLTSYLLVIIDSSGSTGSFLEDYIDAIKEFVTLLDGSATKVAVIEFDGPSTGLFTSTGSTAADSRWITPYLGSSGVYADMDDPADVAQLLSDLDEIESGGYTNWEAAFDRANTLTPVPNNTIFITDGNPTVSNGQCASGDAPDIDYYAAAAGNASRIHMDLGARVIPVLFGSGVNIMYATTLVQSDGTSQGGCFCTCGTPTPDDFTPTAIISSNVSGANPLIDGVDYYTVANATELANLIQDELEGEICIPVTQSISSSQSRSQSPSDSRSQSRSASSSDSQSQSRSASRSQSQSRSSSPSDSRSASPSQSRSHSMSASRSRSRSRSQSASPSDSRSASPSQSRSHSMSASRSRSRSRSQSASPSQSRSASPSQSRSASPSQSRSHSLSVSRSRSRSRSQSASPSDSRSASRSRSHSQSQSASPSDSRSASPSQSRSRSLSASRSRSRSHSQSASPSDSRSASPSDSRSTSPSQSHSASRSLSHSASQSRSDSPSASQSHSVSASESHSASVSASLLECCWLNATAPQPDPPTCQGLAPVTMNAVCYDCMCGDGGAFSGEDCCATGPYLTDECSNVANISFANCQTECCGPFTDMQCMPQFPPNECNQNDCCCDPFQYPMLEPPFMFPLPENESYCGPIIEPCETCLIGFNAGCQLWIDEKGNATTIADDDLIDACQQLHGDPTFCGFFCCQLGNQPPQNVDCPDSQSRSRSASPSRSQSLSSSPSQSRSESYSLSSSQSYSLSRSRSHSPSDANTLSQSTSQSASRSPSRSGSPSDSHSGSPSDSRSASPSDSRSHSPSDSRSGSPSDSRSASGSPSESQSQTTTTSQSSSHSQTNFNTQSLSQSRSNDQTTDSQSQSSSVSAMPEACFLTAFCLISNILAPGAVDIDGCGDFARRGVIPEGIEMINEHANFTWVNQTNMPEDAVTIHVTVASTCLVEWSGVAEGVPSNTPNPTTDFGSSATLVFEGVDFGGDWLNYRSWVNNTDCDAHIIDVEIFYENPATCECPADPFNKPNVFGLCTENPCDHPDAVEGFGDLYPCKCNNTEFDRCGVCGGSGDTCIDTCCERVTPTSPLDNFYPLWQNYKRCENEETVVPMPGMVYSLRSILADLPFDAPPTFGMRIGELTCDFGHPTSLVILNVTDSSLHFTGNVWCGFDSTHANNHGDDYETTPMAHPFTLAYWYTTGVDFSQPGMITVAEGGALPGDVSSENCGTLSSTFDQNVVINLCAKTNDDGIQLKITNGTNAWSEPGITGFGWFMNMECGSNACPYCGLHENDPEVAADLQWCDPADWFFVVEAKCNPNSQSASQSTSPSISQSQSASESESHSRSASPSDSQSHSPSSSHSQSSSQSRSLSQSFSSSASPASCCWLDREDMVPDFDQCGTVEPVDESVPCFDCLCGDGGPLTSNATLDALCCSNAPFLAPACATLEIVTMSPCEDICCGPTTSMQCMPENDPTDCNIVDCCCDPFMHPELMPPFFPRPDGPFCGMPPKFNSTLAAIDFGEAFAQSYNPFCALCLYNLNPLCEEWLESGGTGPDNTTIAACKILHGTDCAPSCCSMAFQPPQECPQSASQSASASASQSASPSESCPPFEPPPDTCDRESYDVLFHPDTYDCVCGSDEWSSCKTCGEIDESCICPCASEGNVCDDYPALQQSGTCLFYDDCHPDGEPTYLEEYKEYNLRSHWGWLKNDSFIGDVKKAPPGFGLIVGNLVLDFSHPKSSMKMRILGDSIHLSGHAWGGYDEDDAGDNGIWDGWELPLGMPRPREMPWMIDCWYTEGVESDLSGVWGPAGQVSEENCCTVMPMKDWNKTIEICAVANDDGWQLLLEKDYRGETGISGFGWFHRPACDERCDPTGMDPMLCGDAEVRFVVETECDDIQSPSESVTPKMPCCERIKPVRVPIEPVAPVPSSSQSLSASASPSSSPSASSSPSVTQTPTRPPGDYDYDYYFPFRRRGEPPSPSPSGDGKEDLFVCDPGLAREIMRLDIEYQVRDHFLDDPWDAETMDNTNSNAPEVMGREFFTMGNLHLTASDNIENVVKLYYFPQSGSVTVSGHVMGRFLDNVTGAALYPDGHPLGRQLYHFEVTYNDNPGPGDCASDFTINDEVQRIPFSNTGGLGFGVSERDCSMGAQGMAVPTPCSNRSGGLFYPKDRPDLVTYFNATDLNVYGQDFLPNVQDYQFIILSAAGLGGIQSFSGYGMYVDKSCLDVDPEPDAEDTDAVFRALVCRATHRRQRGGAAMMFDIEGDCCDEREVPRHVGCTGADCVQGETASETPALQSLSQSESPKNSVTPFQQPEDCIDEELVYGPAPIGQVVVRYINGATLPPALWNDPAISYVDPYNYTESPPFIDSLVAHVVFHHDVVGAGERYVVVGMPADPGREWIFVQVWWRTSVTPVVPNFVTRVGAGPAPKVQCGAAGGQLYTQCWLPYPAQMNQLYIGLATAPKYNLPADFELVGIRVSMYRADNCTTDMRIEYGTAIPMLVRGEDFVEGNPEASPFWYVIGGAAIGGVAAGSMFWRPKSAQAYIREAAVTGALAPPPPSAVAAHAGPGFTRTGLYSQT